MKSASTCLALFAGVIHVRGQWHREQGEFTETKTEAGEREVPIHPILQAILANHIEAGTPEDAYVFASKAEGGRPLSYWNVRDRAWAKIREAAGLPEGTTLHDLRHGCASLLNAQGLSAVDIAEHLGHSDASFTQRTYIHTFGDDREAKIRAAFDVLEDVEHAPPVRIRPEGREAA